MSRVDDIATERQRFNAYSVRNKPLSNTAEADGVAGELALAHLLGLATYKPPTKKRTPGYQICYKDCWKIKVTTSRIAMNLLVKQEKVAADIYVLARIEQKSLEENVTFLGWASSKDVKEAQVKVMTRGKDGQRTTDYEVPSHVIPRAQLRSMVELGQILGFAIDNLDATIREAKPESQMGRLL